MLFQHSFLHILYFSTCLEIFNMFSTYPEIFNIVLVHWNFKHTTCITVFRTCWNFQHALLQFSEHTEIFNMLFYNFQNMLKISTCFFIVFNTLFSICFQHALQISTCSEIFNTLSNMKIWNIYSQIVTEPIQKYSFKKFLVRTQCIKGMKISKVEFWNSPMLWTIVL